MGPSESLECLIRMIYIPAQTRINMNTNNLILNNNLLIVLFLNDCPGAKVEVRVTATTAIMKYKSNGTKNTS
jgi:hypothetical protein